MAKQPPYEEMDQQWGDAPLPDSDQAWQKMKTMLDKEDEKKRRFFPFFFLNSCAGWSLLLVATLGFGVWFFVSQNKKSHEIAAIEKPVGKVNVQEQRQSNTEKRTTAESGHATIENPKTNNTKNKPAPGTTVNATASSNENEVETTSSTETSLKNRVTTELAATRKHKSTERDVANVKEQKAKTKSTKTDVKRRNEESVAVVKHVQQDELINKLTAKSSDVALKNKTEKDNNKTSTESKPRTPLSVKDVAEVKHADAKPVEKKDSVKQTRTDKANDKTETAKQQNKQKEEASFSIGLGIHHLIPTGQFNYVENYNGNKNILSEHIPSVYMEARKGKMSAQLEARFAAPQLIKDFSYSENMTYDTVNNKLLTKEYHLRKAYYHQVSLSFNYEVLPHLSVGMGGMYSVFYRAVVQQELRTKDLQSGSESATFQNIQVPQFSDSFFFKTQMQVLFQTAYEWKRWSLGLRYKKDLEPFIKYTTPDGVLKEEKNGVLEAIVKWQIWKQKKRPKIK